MYILFFLMRIDFMQIQIQISISLGTGAHLSCVLAYTHTELRYFHATRFHSFVVVIITAVYIPSNANTKTALGYFLAVISKQQSIHPDRVFVPAGDFTLVNLKTVLPKLYQHLQFPTRGKTHLTMFTVTSNMDLNYILASLTTSPCSYIQPGH